MSNRATDNEQSDSLLVDIQQYAQDNGIEDDPGVQDLIQRVSRGGPIGDEGARALAKALVRHKNTTLTMLGLGSNNIGDEGARALAEALAHPSNTTLVRLGLSGNVVDEAGAQAFIEALKTNTTLVVLSLGSNFLVGDSVFRVIDAHLEHNRQLLKVPSSSRYIKAVR